MANFLDNATFKQTLVDYTVGMYNEKKNSVAEFISPTVRVPAASGYFKYYNDKEAFQALDTSRGVGGQAKVVQFNAQDKSYNVKPQALDCPIDQLLFKDADQTTAMITYESYLGELVSVALTSHESLVFNVVSNAVTAESGLGSGWSTASGSSATVNPLSEIEKAYYEIATNIGEFPNRILFGPNAWRYVKHAYYSRGLYPMYANNDSEVKSFFSGMGQGAEIRVGIIGKGSNLGQSTRTITNIAGANDIYIFYASNNPSRLDRSAFKTFQMGRGLDNINQYWSPERRSDVLALDWNIDVQLTNPYAVKRITCT